MSRNEANVVRLGLEGLSVPEAIVMAVAAFDRLGWKVDGVHPARIEGHKGISLWSWGERITVALQPGEAIVSSSHLMFTLFAGRRNAANARRFVAAFGEVRAAMTPERMARELDRLGASGVMQQSADALRPMADAQGSDMLRLLIPGRRAMVTPLLIWANVLVYLAMVITGVDPMQPRGEDLLLWGGNFRPLTASGDWWRLITCCFVHIGAVHLLFNAYALLFVGAHLEPLLGRIRMLVAYLITGVAASVASLWWHELTISAGASGAVFGLFGVFLALLTTDLIEPQARRPLLTTMGIFVVYNLIYGLKGNVDNAAHIGGLLSGLVLGYALFTSLRRPANTAIRTMTLALPAALVVFGAGWSLQVLRNDDQVYEDRMQIFYENEELGMRFYQLWNAEKGDVELLQELEVHGLPAWYANRALLLELDALDLSRARAERHRLLHRYCGLRIESFEKLRALLQGADDPDMETDLERLFLEIDRVIAEIKGELPDDEPATW